MQQQPAQENCCSICSSSLDLILCETCQGANGKVVVGDRLVMWEECSQCDNGWQWVCPKCAERVEVKEDLSE